MVVTDGAFAQWFCKAQITGDCQRAPKLVWALADIFRLLWPDIDFERGEVWVQRSLKERKGILELKETKTKHGGRRIRLTKPTLDAMFEHRKRMLAEGHASGPVFRDTDGGWLRKSNFTRRSFNPTLARAGLLKE